MVPEAAGGTGQDDDGQHQQVEIDERADHLAGQLGQPVGAYCAAYRAGQGEAQEQALIDIAGDQMRHAGGASGEHLGGVDGGAGLRGRDAHGQHHRRRHQAECHAQRANALLSSMHRA
ncbi:hypothetical protein G6F63_014850 [Rhizopus arrhizus]|nr:hypothetical protein G6F63_014850 [Rhizopus arrhizus]